MPSTLDLAKRIAALDEHFRRLWRSEFRLEIGGRTLHGRFIRSERPAALHDRYDPERERMTAIRELVRIRLAAYEALLREDGGTLETAVGRVLESGPRAGLLEEIRERIAERIHPVWRIRLTTSTHMVRTLDHAGRDTMFFYTATRSDGFEALRSAMEGDLSDGGIHYDEAALETIRRETPPDSRLPYAAYLDARGGNFTGTGFLEHPIFATAIGDRELMLRYVEALQVVNLGDFYHPGLHSGWRPGEMRAGYGRPIALGLKGEAFYPPNNSTVDHAALVLPIDADF